MRNAITFILLSLFVLLGHSQTFLVSRIESSTLDISAQALSRYDANGEKCALIRVQLPVEGALFEGSIVGDVAFKTNHYLLYMPYTSKRVKVSCPGVHSLMIEFADFNVLLVSGATYDIYCDLAINSNDNGDSGIGKKFPPIAYKDKTGYGFKDIDGNIVVPPIYKEVLDYRDGIAWVKNDISLWGSINEKGEIVVENKYDALSIIGPQQYEQNICIAGWRSDDKGDYAEIIDYKTGNLLHNDKFKHIINYGNDPFSFFCVTNRKGNVICIDKESGSLIYKYPKGKSFTGYYSPSYVGMYDGTLKEGEFAGPRFGIVDLSGKEVVKCNNYEIQTLKGEFRHVVKIHPSKYSFYEQSAYLYDLKLRRQIGSTYYDFFEHKGTWDSPLIVTCLYHGYGNSYYGVLNLVTGQEIIPAANRLYRELIKLPKTQSDPIVAQISKDNNTYCLIDLNGNEYKKVESDSYLQFKNGFSRYGENGKLGFINAFGEVIIEAQYDKVEAFEYDEVGTLRCKVVKDGKTYSIDTNGNII